MKRQTAAQRRKLLDAATVAEFKPAATEIVTLPGLMDRGTFTPRGWVAPDNLSKDGLQQVGLSILSVQRATPWLWADWYIAGGDVDRLRRNDAPNKRTIENYASVAKRFPFSRRSEHVSFTHHAELITLPVKLQDELLEWCASRQQPSVKELRFEIKERTAPKLPPPKKVEPPPEAFPAAVELPRVAAEILPPDPIVVVDDVTTGADIGIDEDTNIAVTIMLPAKLHAALALRAEANAMSLSAWVVRLAQESVH
jgi:hypothetical protein